MKARKVFLSGYLVVLVSLTAWAQSPTTKQRAVDSTYIVSLETLVGKLDDKVRIDSLACAEQKAGLRKALETANSDRVRLGDRNNDLATRNETLAANLDECNSLRESALGKVADLEKQIKPNLFTKAGRAIRDGLAYVGGAAVVVGTLVLIFR